MDLVDLIEADLQYAHVQLTKRQEIIVSVKDLVTLLLLLHIIL